jgi:carbohydrate-selective porin OprB
LLKQHLAFERPRFFCLVFSILFLTLPALGAQTDKPTAPPLSTSDADPNAIPSTSGGDADVTELLAEDKTIIKKASEEGAHISDPNQIQKTDPNSPPASDPNEVEKEPSPSADPNLLAGAEGSRDVTELLAESKEVPPRMWVEDEVVMKLMAPYTKAKTYLHEEWELDTAMEHVLIYQRATGGRRPREQATYNFTWFGVWNFSKYMGKEDAGVIGFSFEERDNVTDHSVREFSQEVGTNYRTHGLNTNERSRTAVRQLWWRRTFLDKTVTATVGKLHHPSYYNRNSFAGNSRTYFLSNPFSRNPNRLTPQDGLGANVTIKPNDAYYFSVGLGDAEADNKTSGFDTIGDGHLFTAVEFGLTPTIEGTGRGNYRFTFWHTNQADGEATTDDRGDDGSGVALSFDQELNKTVGLFARYGYTEPQVTTIKNFVSGGFVLRDSWGFKDDLFGVGLSWDQPSDGKDDEVSMEVFQRFQFTSRVQITPSILVIFDSSQSDKTEPAAVFGIRFRALF